MKKFTVDLEDEDVAKLEQEAKLNERSVGAELRMTIRSPKVCYFAGGFIEFKRDGDKITYKVWKYTDKEMNHLSLLKTGKYHGQSKEEMLNLA